jgi:predicted NUDIX family phosphoesterase
MKEENVLVVKTELLAPYIRGKNGLITGCEAEVEALVAEKHEFLPRSFAEEHPEYKQIIPYVTVCRGAQVFATTRLNKGGEARLHGLMSLGVGGHINDGESTAENALMSGLIREIHEEVALDDFGDLTLRGLINDDSNEVGSVHLGFFYTLTTSGEVSVRETEKLSGSWVQRSELWDKAPGMETWSQIIIPTLA